MVSCSVQQAPHPPQFPGTLCLCARPAAPPSLSLPNQLMLVLPPNCSLIPVTNSWSAFEPQTQVTSIKEPPTIH